jgi:hypothetical protein
MLLELSKKKRMKPEDIVEQQVKHLYENGK